MLKRFLDWVIYGDCSQEPSDNIEFLKGFHRTAERKEEPELSKDSYNHYTTHGQ